MYSEKQKWKFYSLYKRFSETSSRTPTLTTGTPLPVCVITKHLSWMGPSSLTRTPSVHRWGNGDPWQGGGRQGHPARPLGFGCLFSLSLILSTTLAQQSRRKTQLSKRIRVRSTHVDRFRSQSGVFSSLLKAASTLYT